MSLSEDFLIGVLKIKGSPAIGPPIMYAFSKITLRDFYEVRLPPNSLVALLQFTARKIRF